ncbi:hypothetical protein [Piscirickettsia litoralis]|uniref:Uncharacterized protein n=1 Tax=Piscirickettsia litoralis TaxID=1891921 RepID=A0ABX2ZYV6_9GAMM|nr:hypothetical protein [Piscirickettsia litoralis]ODN41385.1 hypothetical protein BGC07_16585 [Piscirickettsia litoralis]
MSNSTEPSLSLQLSKTDIRDLGAMLHFLQSRAKQPIPVAQRILKQLDSPALLSQPDNHSKQVIVTGLCSAEIR